MNKNKAIPVDDNLIAYAENRAKEILGKHMAYSPGEHVQTILPGEDVQSIVSTEEGAMERETVEADKE